MYWLLPLKTHMHLKILVVRPPLFIKKIMETNANNTPNQSTQELLAKINQICNSYHPKFKFETRQGFNSPHKISINQIQIIPNSNSHENLQVFTYSAMSDIRKGGVESTYLTDITARGGSSTDFNPTASILFQVFLLLFSIRKLYIVLHYNH